MGYINVIKIIFTVFFSVLIIVGDARAACVNPSQPEGAQVYNSTYKTMQFCDGSVWWNMKSGGGVSSLAGLSDTEIASPTDGQIITYDSASGKWVSMDGGTSGGNNVAPTISFSGGGTLTVTLANNIPLYQNNSRDAWSNYGTLPSFLVGTRGTDTVNGTPDGSAVTLTITGGPAVCYQMRNEGGWSPVNTTGWSVKATAPADFTTFAGTGIDMIRERVFQPGSYTLDSFSAMYACSTSPVGGGSPGGSSTQVQFNDGGAFAGAAQLYWDKANNRLGIGTATPAVDLEVSGIMRAIDDAAGCAAAERGAIRFNSGAGVLEVCNEGAWGTLASGGSGLTGYEVVQVDQPAGAAVGWYWAACPGTKKVLGGSCTTGSGSAVTNTSISGQSFGCYKATTSTNYQIKAACAEGSGGGDSGSPLWSAGTGDNIYFNSGSGNVGIGTTSPGQKLTVAGTVESTSGGIKFPDGTTQTSAAALPTTCSIGEPLSWNGSAWVCADQLILVGGKSFSDCKVVGTPVDIGGGNFICQVSVASEQEGCPAGWAQYQDWSETISRFINPGCGASCTTTAVPWDNSVKAACECAAAGVCGPCSAVADNPAIRKRGCI